MSNPTDPSGPDRNDKLQIDVLADEFERALKAGQSPRIEDFVNQVREGARLAAMRELLEVEMELRHGIVQSADATRAEQISSSNGAAQAGGDEC